MEVRAGKTRERGPWRVLIADDAVGARLNLAVALKGFDPTLEIDEASDGKAALDRLMHHTPDVAFVNVQLPALSGAEALAFAKMHGVRTTTVLMSNLVMPKWVDLSVELDAYEFLKKPFDPEHIVLLLKGVQRMREPSRILLVEDSQTARALVRRVLAGTRFNLEIDETDDGRHALKLMQLTSYDLALIDFNLDGLDGLETACQAREASPDTRLLMMSGTDNESIASAAKHFGVAAFLRKPFYVRDVENALHRAFGLRRPYLLNAIVNAGRPARPRPATAS